jgi:hypothetical protein
MFTIEEIIVTKPYKEFIDYGRLDCNETLYEIYHKCLNALYSIYNSFNEHQMESFILLNNKSDLKVQFRHPTGCGKGYLMIANILTNIVNGERLQTILSHRLMLNNQHIIDLINLIIEFDLIKHVSFACIGSDNSIERNFFKIITRNNKKRANELVGKFLKNDIRVNSFILSTISKTSFGEFYDSCMAEDKVMIITSTYNSCRLLGDYNIDSIYCDEAHTICNSRIDESEDTFFENVLSLNSKASYFFSATPKDSDGNYQEYSDLLDTKYGKITKKPVRSKYKHINDYYYDVDRYEDYLLYKKNSEELISNKFMDNTDIFGKIHEIKYTDAIKNLYITTPVIKTVLACNYNDITITEVDSRKVTGLKGKLKSIVDTYNDLKSETNKWCLNYNRNKDFIIEMGAKLLIKCNSALDVFAIFEEVIKEVSLADVNIAYCTSSYGTKIRKSDGTLHNYDEKREEFITTLQSLKLNVKLIVIHCDIMAEGINVWGFNGLLLLTTKEMSSLTKVLQNIGRTTRLLDIDRELIRSKRNSKEAITFSNRKEHLLKPYSFVYLLQMDDTTQQISNEVKGHLMRLLDETCDYNGSTIVGIGAEDYYIGLGTEDIYRENQINKVHIGETYDKSIIYTDEVSKLKIIDAIRNSVSTEEKIKSVYRNI